MKKNVSLKIGPSTPVTGEKIYLDAGFVYLVVDDGPEFRVVFGYMMKPGQTIREEKEGEYVVQD